MTCETNTSIECPCTYSCEKHGKCCACIAYHRPYGEFPACFFRVETEMTYDRSFTALKKDREKKS